ncbi:MAG: hypothetical protein A2820_01365 [Candidatus Buchananbacteria bacterium RIFCSPHIGHO2_01_FULL_40_35]|nr:MAG: hypothetical protein A2820_01365 [Candidatus Buchananbacteria bacterium RIFCSPHIGHO2_01_FULL_40_35]
MLIGQDNLRDTFKRLIKDGDLAHGYIFFGEPQVGKYSFALSLAAFLEDGKFEEIETESGLPKRILEEALIIKPVEGSIGIDSVREIRHFLSQMPVKSNLRVVIIDDADTMTIQAQHATLKIGEEPPSKSLIILVTQNFDSLLETLKSRFQKIHFPRLSAGEITGLLEKHHNVDKKNADELAALSLGRPGRAVSLATNDSAKKQFKNATALLSRKEPKRKIIDEVLESEIEMRALLTEIIAKLANDPVKNYDILKSITERMTAMSQFSTNKRLQLESAIWTI